MNSHFEELKQGAIRALIVAGLVIAFGFIVFQSYAFNPTLTSFEFVANGITIAIAYAALKGETPRQAFIALLLWYVVLTGMLYYPYRVWNFVMEACYLIGLTGAVTLYLYVVNKRLVRGLLQRIFAAALIIGAAHGLIVVHLQFVSFRVLVHPMKTLEWSFMNLKNGTVIGVVTAVGVEIAEYLLTLRSQRGFVSTPHVR